MSEPERPSNDEYDPYYATYIGLIKDAGVLAVLRQQQSTTESWIRSLTADQASTRYAPDKWSVKEVLGHMCDTERIFAYRSLCIARGESQSLPGMDQDVYARVADFDSRSVESQAEEYAAVRAATLALFESLDVEAWDRSGVANGVAISVRALAFIIAGHERHHMTLLRDRYHMEVQIEQ